MAEEPKTTLSEVITSTTEEKKVETVPNPETQPQTEIKKEETISSEPKKKSKQHKKIKIKVFKYFLFFINIIKIVIKKIEETFNNLDKYEKILNDIDQNLWDFIKFPMENIIEEGKLIFFDNKKFI